MKPKNIVIACQGGGAHDAYAAGALQTLLPKLQKEESRLVGISGTSGGAICALLAWYGLLQGGPELAREKLAQFWQSNCAQLPGEMLWNDSSIRAQGTVRQEILYSPYEWPLKASVMMLTEVWPSFAKMLGTNNHWMRADYFKLDELISQHVNFELIAALGEFLQIPFDIQRWLDTDLQASLCRRLPTPLSHLTQTKEHLENRIRNALTMPVKLMELMDAHNFEANAPLRLVFENWKTPELNKFEAPSLAGLSDQIKYLMQDIPQLLIGATDIGSGEFTAFSSERSATGGGISLPAVLASAALPWLFEAVPVEWESEDGSLTTRRYWDGLFSQNPPIRNFISNLVCKARKPEEIWVLQINPGVYDTNELSRDIWDRRNELAGNLSLNQEISFIKSINKRNAIAQTSDTKNQGKLDTEGEGRKDKHIQVHRIILDGTHLEQVLANQQLSLLPSKKLGALSKFDRNLKLKDALVTHGNEQAEKFLTLRRIIASICNDLHSPAYEMSPEQLGESNAALAMLQSITDPAAQSCTRLIANEICLPALTKIDKTTGQPQTPADATVYWHTHGTTEEGLEVRVEGASEFIVVKNGSDQVHVRDIRITGIKTLKTPAMPGSKAAPTKIKPPATGKVVSIERRMNSIPVPTERRSRYPSQGAL